MPREPLLPNRLSLTFAGLYLYIVCDSTDEYGLSWFSIVCVVLYGRVVPFPAASLNYRDIIHTQRHIFISFSSSLFQGKASGNRAALWLRAKMQDELFVLGRSIQRHAGKVLFVGVLVLATFCVGLKSANMESRAEKLWVEGKEFIITGGVFSN